MKAYTTLLLSLFIFASLACAPDGQTQGQGTDEPERDFCLGLPDEIADMILRKIPAWKRNSSELVFGRACAPLFNKLPPATASSDLNYVRIGRAYESKDSSKIYTPMPTFRGILERKGSTNKLITLGVPFGELVESPWRRVYTTSTQTNLLIVLNTNDTKGYHSIEVPGGPLTPVFDGDFIFVAQSKSTTILVLDRHTEQVHTVIALPFSPLNIRKIGKYLWVSGNNTLSLIEPKTFQVLSTITVGKSPRLQRSNTPSGENNEVWVSIQEPASAILLSPNEGKISSRIKISLPSPPSPVVSDPNTPDIFYITLPLKDSSRILRVNNKDKAVTHKIEFKEGTNDLVYWKNQLYAAHPKSGTISVLDANLTKITTLNPGPQPLLENPEKDKDTLLVSSSENAKLYKTDREKNKLILLTSVAAEYGINSTVSNKNSIILYDFKWSVLVHYNTVNNSIQGKYPIQALETIIADNRWVYAIWPNKIVPLDLDSGAFSEVIMLKNRIRPSTAQIISGKIYAIGDNGQLLLIDPDERTQSLVTDTKLDEKPLRIGNFLYGVGKSSYNSTSAHITRITLETHSEKRLGEIPLLGKDTRLSLLGNQNERLIAIENDFWVPKNILVIDTNSLEVLSRKEISKLGSTSNFSVLLNNGFLILLETNYNSSFIHSFSLQDDFTWLQTGVSPKLNLGINATWLNVTYFTPIGSYLLLPKKDKVQVFPTPQLTPSQSLPMNLGEFSKPILSGQYLYIIHKISDDTNQVLTRIYIGES